MGLYNVPLSMFIALQVNHAMSNVSFLVDKRKNDFSLSPKLFHKIRYIKKFNIHIDRLCRYIFFYFKHIQNNKLNNFGVAVLLTGFLFKRESNMGFFFSIIRDLCTKYKFSIKSDDFDVWLILKMNRALYFVDDNLCNKCLCIIIF